MQYNFQVSQSKCDVWHDRIGVVGVFSFVDTFGVDPIERCHVALKFHVKLWFMD